VVKVRELFVSPAGSLVDLEICKGAVGGPPTAAREARAVPVGHVKFVAATDSA